MVLVTSKRLSGSGLLGADDDLIGGGQHGALEIGGRDLRVRHLDGAGDVDLAAVDREIEVRRGVDLRFRDVHDPQVHPLAA